MRGIVLLAFLFSTLAPTSLASIKEKHFSGSLQITEGSKSTFAVILGIRSLTKHKADFKERQYVIYPDGKVEEKLFVVEFPAEQKKGTVIRYDGSGKNVIARGTIEYTGKPEAWESNTFEYKLADGTVTGSDKYYPEANIFSKSDGKLQKLNGQVITFEATFREITYQEFEIWESLLKHSQSR